MRNMAVLHIPKPVLQKKEIFSLARLLALGNIRDKNLVVWFRGPKPLVFRTWLAMPVIQWFFPILELPSRWSLIKLHICRPKEIVLENIRDKNLEVWFQGPKSICIRNLVVGRARHSSTNDFFLFSFRYMHHLRLMIVVYCPICGPLWPQNNN
jgi:hypothetical protein